MKRKNLRNQIALHGGAYSLIITVIVLAILVAVNILVSALPKNVTQYDISSTKLYSVTSNTKVVVNALDKDVTIYWIVQADEEDDVIENLLAKYESLSKHIKVVKKNPDIYPTFAEQYTSETVQNNSLVVECGERSRFIGYNDIYLMEANMNSYSYDTSFDGEGAITSGRHRFISISESKRCGGWQRTILDDLQFSAGTGTSSSARNLRSSWRNVPRYKSLLFAVSS